MKVGKLLVPLGLMFGLAVAINAYVAQNRQSTRPIERSINQPQETEPQKQALIRNSLAALLTPEGVVVGVSLPTLDNRTYKELRVRWQSAGASAQSQSDNLKQGPPSGAITFLASAKKEGTLPRDRSFELSTNQVLAIGVGEKVDLRWWKLLLDPRLVRAESPAASGELSGQEYYLNNVEFMIAYPDDLSIREVRLYHPLWTGKEFQLELLGALAVK